MINKNIRNEWVGKTVTTPMGEGIVTHAKPTLSGGTSLRVRRPLGVGWMDSSWVTVLDNF